MIYAIQAGESGPIKIGRTSRDSPNDRLGNLQVAHYETLRILASMHPVPDDIVQEKRFHQRLAAHRIRGEWFKPTEETLAVVEEIKRGPQTTRECAKAIVEDYRKAVRIHTLTRILNLVKALSRAKPVHQS